MFSSLAQKGGLNFSENKRNNRRSGRQLIKIVSQANNSLGLNE